MKKTHPHTELSNRVCIDRGCERKIKKRLIKQKPTVDRCYKCHAKSEAGRGHTINSQPRKKRVAASLPVKKFN